MTHKLRMLSSMLLVALLVAACGGTLLNSNTAPDSSNTTPTPGDAMAGDETMGDDEAGMDGDETMGDDEASMDGDDSMDGDETMSDDKASMDGDDSMDGDETMSDDEASMDGDDSMDGDETMGDDEAGMDGEETMGQEDGKVMMELPDWFHAELTDVNSGQAFSLTDFQGRVVLVETMAIWCPSCLRQQQEVKALHEALGEDANLVTVVLDIDSNEDAASLKDYAAGHGFDWIYAVAPRKVPREIGQLYGDQFLNPPSTPMLIVDRHGEVHLLPFGRKTAADLEAALAPFLDEGM